jgi:TPR repeat protein
MPVKVTRMKTLQRFLQQRIHTLATFVSVGILAFVLSGCASTGGPSSGRSVSELKAAAEKGDPQAQYELGDAYFYGRGVPKNYTEAERWYKKAQETYSAKK